MNYHDGMIRWCDHTAREECPNSLGKAGPPVQSVVGALTWNPLGTLASLAITDPFYSGGNQSCSYSHDDLTRIASANCGSVWSQTFSYDAFGNISKSGSISFLPTYSYLTNRMTQIGSSSPTYDSNGNVTNDFLHTYAWDAAGRPVTIDTVGAMYDAPGKRFAASKKRNGKVAGCGCPEHRGLIASRRLLVGRFPVPKARQLTVSCENCPGTLADIAGILGKAKVNILAFNASSAGAMGYIQFVVDNANKAKKALKRKGIPCYEELVLHVRLPNVPGALARFSRKLAAKDINIGAGYQTTVLKSDEASVVLAVSHLESASRVR